MHERGNNAFRGGYYVGVSGSDRKKVLWEVVDDCVV